MLIFMLFKPYIDLTKRILTLQKYVLDQLFDSEL